MACKANIRSLERLDKRWLAKQTLVSFLSGNGKESRRQTNSLIYLFAKLLRE